MKGIDLRDLGLNVAGVVRGLSDGTTVHPLYITDQGEPVAFMIRHQAYTPRLHRFGATYDEGYQCLDCMDAGDHWVTGRLENLADVHQAANEHWRATHYVRTEHVVRGMCHYPNPDSTWARCYLEHRHDGAHQSAAGIWPASPDE